MKNKRMPYLSDLRNIIISEDKKHGSLSHFLIVDGRTYTVIVSFNNDISILGIKRAMLDMEKAFVDFSKKEDVSLRFGIGQIYHSILDIGFSCNEAINALSAFIALQDEQTLVPNNTKANSTEKIIDIRLV
jgi:hypothetical protein